MLLIPPEIISTSLGVSNLASPNLNSSKFEYEDWASCAMCSSNIPFLSNTALRTSVCISVKLTEGTSMLYRFRLFRNAEASRESSHQVLDESAPLVTPAPPTLFFSINKIFFLKSNALMAAAYPDGPAPIITKSYFTIVELKPWLLNYKFYARVYECRKKLTFYQNV